MAGAGAAGAVAALRVGQPPSRILLFWGARQDLQGDLGVVYRRGDLQASLGHAPGNGARVRDRLGGRARRGIVARALALGLAASRSLHPRLRRPAQRRPPAHLQAAVGAFAINTVVPGILVLTAFALILDLAVGRMERRLLVWRPTQSETEQL